MRRLFAASSSQLSDFTSNAGMPAVDPTANCLQSGSHEATKAARETISDSAGAERVASAPAVSPAVPAAWVARRSINSVGTSSLGRHDHENSEALNSVPFGSSPGTMRGFPCTLHVNAHRRLQFCAADDADRSSGFATTLTASNRWAWHQNSGSLWYGGGVHCAETC